jgi:hypothetical protein
LKKGIEFDALFYCATQSGRAIDTQQIFSGGGTDYTPLFRALVVQRHRRALSDDEFLHLLKAHVDHGFQLIKNDTAGFKFEDDYVDYLVELTRAGLEQRTQEAAPTIAADCFPCKSVGKMTRP